jgi:hypothetical protein
LASSFLEVKIKNQREALSSLKVNIKIKNQREALSSLKVNINIKNQRAFFDLKNQRDRCQGSFRAGESKT